jgi:hypothetical protein
MAYLAEEDERKYKKCTRSYDNVVPHPKILLASMDGSTHSLVVSVYNSSSGRNTTFRTIRICIK